MVDEFECSYCGETIDDENIHEAIIIDTETIYCDEHCLKCELCKS